MDGTFFRRSNSSIGQSESCRVETDCQKLSRDQKLDFDETGPARRVSPITLLTIYVNPDLDVPTWQEFITKASKLIGLSILPFSLPWPIERHPSRSCGD